MPIGFAVPSANGRRVGVLAFNKHIAQELQGRICGSNAVSTTGPAPLVPGTPQQEAFWKFVAEGSAHGELNARAGTGKTFSIVQAVLRIPGANVQVCTYHSLGWRAIRKAYPQAQLDDRKMDMAIRDCYDGSGHGPIRMLYAEVRQIRRLVSLLRNNLTAPTAESVAEVCEHHDLDLPSRLGFNQILEGLPCVLERTERLSVVDFDDQIYLPVKMQLPLPEFDYLFVDESQDTNRCQRQLARLACPHGRIFVVGDPHQAIYGFRGADAQSMPRMREELRATPQGVELYPLTVTRRCPKSHVSLARGIVPDIDPMEDAPDGTIAEGLEDLRGVREGDLVLCRTNAPLIEACLSLIASGVRARIQGRDVGAGLVNFVRSFQADTLSDLLRRMDDYVGREASKVPGIGERRMEALYDRVRCLAALQLGLPSVDDLVRRIEWLFTDVASAGRGSGMVVLGTVHRTKGLEANRVFILEPKLIPHPLAKKPWEVEQERNLAYVAATRAKFGGGDGSGDGYLGFLGGCPSIYVEGRGSWK